MHKLFLTLLLLVSTQICQAQFFQATINTEGNDLIFKIRPNPGGGDITTDWSDIEFFVRWADGSKLFSFGAVTMNSAQFTGVPEFSRNLPNGNGQDAGFANAWFGSSFSATPESTYLDGTEYEVFRVTLDIPARDIPFFLVANDGFSPTYLALTSATGGRDLTNTMGNKFYGPDATSCTACPGQGTNYLDRGADVALPVELLFFTAQSAGKQAKISWQTASEYNNDYFTVERSTDGRNFEYVQEVSGYGTTDQRNSYQVFDKSPVAGANYYRLKQTDFDDSFAYSKIAVLDFDGPAITMEVFPNPAKDQVNLQLSGSGEGGHVQLFSLSGKLLKELSLNGNPGVTLPVGDLARGVYLVRLELGGQRYTRKLVLQ